MVEHVGYNDCVNFKVLQRRILLQVERAPGEKNLLERNGCGYKVDPLTSVLTLEKHLHTMVRFYAANFKCSTAAYAHDNFYKVEIA